MKKRNTNTTPDGLTPSTAPATTPAPEAPAEPLPIGAQTFPRLYKLICKHYITEARRYTFFIKKGYFPERAPEHHTNPDAGIIKYLTPARLAKYERGELPRSEAEKIATARALKEVNTYKAEKIKKLNAAALATLPDCVAVFVTWTRSRVWGYNPRAEVRTGASCYADTTTGSASGCGYDKQSAAIAEALNKSAAVLRILYTTTEKALKKGYKPPESGALWGGVLGYGAGCSVLPYFEGGCGVSVIKNIFTACGFELSAESDGEHVTAYTFTPARKGGAKK